MTKAIILAAGEGTRMHSSIPKPMHEILQKPMLYYITKACEEAKIEDIICVVGNGREKVISYFSEKSNIKFVEQPTDKSLGYGTGFAVISAKEHIELDEDYLILCGDTPLLKSETISFLMEAHKKNCNDVSVMSAIVDNPKGYGRIVCDENKISIVEEKEATEHQREIKEINTGIYIFKGSCLLNALNNLSNNNEKNEYYLTDAIKFLSDENLKIRVYQNKCADDILGVNDCIDLEKANKIMQKRINTFWMKKGVRMINLEQVFIGPEVLLEEDIFLGIGTMLYGKTIIKSGTIIEDNVRIENSSIGENVKIIKSVILNSKIGNETTVGPFAYIRPNCNIGDNVKLGDFVEVKNSNIGNGTKASHLAYIGDADLGERINVGCGVVFVNYDGKNKFRSKVENDAFIGSNSNLVAPVHIDSFGYIAAGSTITNDVEAYALSIARARQVNKSNWVKK